MPRYIDADELLKVLEVFSKKEGEKTAFFAQKNIGELFAKYNHGQYCFENVKEMVNTMPTANVVEVKCGKNTTKCHPVDEFICSECGLWLQDLSEYQMDEDDGDVTCHEFEVKHCPRCGVKIDDFWGDSNE